ncbi:hypothetical protein Bbelb_203800 [Branchiostoma belcheri]|nr:hypothetical protein Bbelb_203800 [Branchiostoma belcheri]
MPLAGQMAAGVQVVQFPGSPPSPPYGTRTLARDMMSPHCLEFYTDQKTLLNYRSPDKSLMTDGRRWERHCGENSVKDYVARSEDLAAALFCGKQGRNRCGALALECEVVASRSLAEARTTRTTILDYSSVQHLLTDRGVPELKQSAQRKTNGDEPRAFGARLAPTPLEVPSSTSAAVEQVNTTSEEREACRIRNATWGIGARTSVEVVETGKPLTPGTLGIEPAPKASSQLTTPVR